jgi:hypothetical protein
LDFIVLLSVIIGVYISTPRRNGYLKIAVIAKKIVRNE